MEPAHLECRGEDSLAKSPEPPGQSEPRAHARPSGTSGGQGSRGGSGQHLGRARERSRSRSPPRRRPSSPAGASGSRRRRPGRSGGVVAGKRSRSRRSSGPARAPRAHTSPEAEGARRQAVVQERRRRGSTGSTGSASSCTSHRRLAGRGGRCGPSSSSGSSSGSGGARGRTPPGDGIGPARHRAGAGGDAEAALSRWDMRPTAQTVREEIEIRNRLALGTLFMELPAFQEMYPSLGDPIVALTLRSAETGPYSFVEFRDDTLASTAILFSGFELRGRSVGIQRPLGYIPAPGGHAKPLDVTPLRQCGLLPMVPSRGNEGKLRQLYFGNLARGRTSPEVIMNLLNPVAQKLAEFRAEDGPAVTNISMGADDVHAFVQFQSQKLATKIMQMFDGQAVFGRCLRVRRTSISPSEASTVAPLELQAVEALMAKLPDKVASTSHVAPFIRQLARPGPSSTPATPAVPPTDPLAMSPVQGAPPSATAASPPPGAPMQTTAAAAPPPPSCEATAQPASAPPQVSAAPLATASSHEATVAEPLAMLPPTGAPLMAASAPPPPRVPEQPAAVVAPPSPRASPQPVTAPSPATAPPATASLQEVPEAQQPPHEAPAQLTLATPQATRGFEEPTSAVAVGATAAPSAAALTPPATSEAPQNPDVLDGMPHGEPAAATAVEAASASPPLLTSLTAL
ncbi:unnamed protein product [Prorocentrum cordatum]|uniref:RRM domain-containing protein n=1 Tax=Prorocentrum cordatum TaxID=2364126 RepID=A0ABN9WQK1_9DINO|nr:unnamed protein product [Polarella glacialis]